MKKYKLYRSFGDLDENVNKHVLVAVEYSENIDTVTDVFIEAANDDALGLPQYEKGFTTVAYAPELISKHQRAERYAYIITAVLLPDYGEQNDLLEYGVIEEDTDEV